MAANKHFSLSDLLSGIYLGDIDSSFSSVSIQSLFQDSRESSPNGLFFAQKGLRIDGHEQIPQAIQNGAKAVIGERDFPGNRFGKIPYIRVSDSRKIMGEIASRFYGDPSLQLKLVGVTGTSGKTSTALILESIFHEAGWKPGLMGTIVTRSLKREFSSSYTTPDSISIQRTLRSFVEDGCESAVMEVSSHSIDQYRVSGCSFDAVGFTNLSPEHLDYHSSMEDYFETKKRLFFEWIDNAKLRGKTPRRVVSVQGKYGIQLAQELKEAGASVFTDESITLDVDPVRGITGNIDGIEVKSDLMGSFQAQNIQVALLLARSLGVENQSIEEGIQGLKGVPGRLERVETGTRVFVDYAHKPDALEKVLKNLDSARDSDEKLIVVMGCGGDRDRLKRPLMGDIAAQRADYLILTSDNPRSEDPQLILNEIQKGISSAYETQVELIEDREAAILRAIEIAKGSDWVLIAGKGHEKTQARKGLNGEIENVPFDDVEVARLALRSQSRTK